MELAWPGLWTAGSIEPVYLQVLQRLDPDLKDCTSKCRRVVRRQAKVLTSLDSFFRLSLHTLNNIGPRALALGLTKLLRVANLGDRWKHLSNHTNLWSSPRVQREVVYVRVSNSVGQNIPQSKVDPRGDTSLATKQFQQEKTSRKPSTQSNHLYRIAHFLPKGLEWNYLSKCVNIPLVMHTPNENRSI